MAKTLITGGTGSVGQQLVKSFIKIGDEVYFQYFRKEKRAGELLNSLGAFPLRIDFSKTELKLPEEKFDIIINCAAINDTNGPAESIKSQLWDNTLAINLTVPFKIIQKNLDYMKKIKKGRIINISSIYGLRGTEERLPYCVSKHGLSGLTKVIAREYGSHGITCNEICPGPIESEMLNRIISNQQEKEELIKEIPTGRLALPMDVASLALFLASDSAEYINGASIPLDGGLIA